MADRPARPSSDIGVRRAGPPDVPALIVLRHAMFGEMASAGVAARASAAADTGDTGWYPAASAVFADQFDRGSAAAFVVDDLPGDGLLACAVATLEQRLPGPGFPTGLTGGMSSVFAQPAHRSRGLARAVVGAALRWLDEQGAEIVDLHATPAAAGLYRSLGFAAPASSALRRLARPD